jgi:signal peptide peptidase SppA
MKHQHVMDWIHSHCWAITPEAMELILQVANREFSDMQAVALKRAEYVQNTSFTGVRDGVAVIDVIGPIFTRASFFQSISGATDVERLAEDFGKVLADKSVHSILLNIDSPGGEVSGISEFATAIREANKTKPVYAFVQGMGASAAYWIASAAKEIYISDTAMVGSIGVIMAMQTQEPKAGTKTYEFVSSQSPNKRPSLETDAGRAKYQSLVDSMGAVFVETVAKYRGVTAETVQQKFGQGGMFIGQEAVSLGMADKVSTFEATLKALVTNHQQSNGGLFMDENELKAKHPATYSAVFAAGEAAEKAKALTATETAKVEAAKAERERIQAIEALKAPGYENIIAENKYKPEMTKDKVSALILSAQAETLAKVTGAHNNDATLVAGKVTGSNAPEAPEASELKALTAIAAKAASR